MKDWLSLSEVIAGGVFKYKFAVRDTDVLKISPNSVRPQLFHPPIDEYIEKLCTPGITPEDLLLKFPNTFQTTRYAVESLNGVSKSNIDWVGLLTRKSAEFQAAEEFEQFAKKLKNGDDVDWVKIAGIAKKAQMAENVNAYTPLSEVQRMKIPFVETGWDAIDEHLGGLPAFGMIVLEGYPKSGKTTAIAKLSGKFAAHHPDKKVAIHTYEMIQEEIAMRFDEIEKLPKDIQKRILLRDMPETPEKAVNIMASEENLGLVIIDFADFMIQGETNESAMSHIYRTISVGAKQLRIPVILIAQLSGSRGGIPRPQDIRYTRLAEAFSSMVLAVYNPHTQRHYENPDEKLLPIMPNAAYLVCWLVRGGFRKHIDDSPGAIAMGWNGQRGWSNNGKWFAIRE